MNLFDIFLTLFKRFGTGMSLVTIYLILGSCQTKSKTSEVYSSPILDSIERNINYSERSDLSKEDRLKYISKATSFAQIIENDSIRRERLVNIRKAYYGLRETDAFRKINDEIIGLSIKMNDSSGIADAHSNYGYYYYEKEKVDSAYNSYFKAQRIYEKLNDPQKAGRAILAMAILQKNVKDYVGGAASSIKAIEYLTPFNDFKDLASANNNLGLIENELGRYDEAIAYHENALAFRKNLQNERALEVSSLNNIGIVYTNKGEYQKAIDYYLEGLAYDSLIQKRPKTYARLLDNLAQAKFLAGETEDLPERFLKSLYIRDSISDNLGAVTSNLNLSEYYLSIDSVSIANKYAKIAFKKATPLNYHRGILESLLLLTKTSTNQEAVNYAQAYIRIDDSLQKKERKYQDQFARIRFETDVIETEKDKVTQQFKNLLTILLVLVAAFLLIYILIQRKLNRKELRFIQSQQEANEEIYSLMLAQQFKLEEGKQIGKQRISEELHDGILGRLFGTRLSLDSLNSKNDEATIQSRFKHINELKSIEQEIRQISHDLNASVFNPEDIYVDVIENLINNNCSSSAFEFQFHHDKEINWEEIPDTKKVHFYRIIQESLQNIHKHAQAKLVKISFKKEQDSIILEIEDDGSGMSTVGHKKGIGLKNIASRAKQLNGVFSLISKKGKGTKILIKTNF